MLLSAVRFLDVWHASHISTLQDRCVDFENEGRCEGSGHGGTIQRLMKCSGLELHGELTSDRASGRSEELSGMLTWGCVVSQSPAAAQSFSHLDCVTRAVLRWAEWSSAL